MAETQDYPIERPDLPRRATVYEVGPRDGLQNEAEKLPVDVRVRFVDLLTEAGLPAIEELTRLWASLEQAEHDARVDFLREPDLGFAWVAWRWAKGDPLDAVLLDASQAPGDFVRWMKQLIDLLDQIGDAAPEGSPVRATAVAVRWPSGSRPS